MAAENPSSATVHLSLMRGERGLAVGTGVLYRFQGRLFLVSAWHNFTGRHAESLQILDSKAAIPDSVIARIDCEIAFPGAPPSRMRFPFRIWLENGGSTQYLVHPTPWPRADVAAIEIVPDKGYACEYVSPTGERYTIDLPIVDTRGVSRVSGVRAIQDFERGLINGPRGLQDYIDVSDELFVIGYPRGITDIHSQPLWKRASVATTPDLGWGRQKKFLID